MKNKCGECLNAGKIVDLTEMGGEEQLHKSECKAYVASFKCCLKKMGIELIDNKTDSRLGMQSGEIKHSTINEKKLGVTKEDWVKGRRCAFTILHAYSGTLGHVKRTFSKYTCPENSIMTRDSIPEEMPKRFK